MDAVADPSHEAEAVLDAMVGVNSSHAIKCSGMGILRPHRNTNLHIL